jgi:subtilisin family serine protease
MLRLFSAVAVVCTLNLAFFVPRAHASSAVSARTQRVLIQFSGQPVAADPNLRARDRATLGRYRFDPSLLAARGYSTAIDGYQNLEIAYLESQGIRLNVDRKLQILWNGIAADVPENQLQKLAALSNVAAVLPDRKIIVPELDHSLPLVKAPAAWNDVGGQAQAGKNVLIADIDTGIDITNPCFSDKGFAPPPFGRRADTNGNLKLTNNKVIIARAFGGTATGGYSAADTQGHGTFTAAIEACDANTPTPLGTKISGVAPDAYLGNYNVFPQTGGDQITEDPVFDALGSALKDGADVANLSLGDSLGTGDPRLDPELGQIKLAAAAGMVVVVSAGNGGPTGQSVSAPSTAPDAISVGASTNSRAVGSTVDFSGAGLPSDLQHARAQESSHAFAIKIGPAQMVYVGLGRKPSTNQVQQDPENPNADDFAGKDLHGKIALIKRGTITFDLKIKNATAAGAIGVIVFDNIDELSPITMSTPTATLPAMFISRINGQNLLSYLGTHPDATATLDPTKIIVPETPNLLSDFSSRGYGPDYTIKPDLVAPGQDIYSATESTDPSGESYDPSGFTAADGTSFSAPHVTGAAALVFQKHPTWKPEVVKAALMETASINTLSDPSGQPLGIMQVGSGLMDVDASLTTPAYVLPSSVSLGAVNVGAGAVHQNMSLTLTDAGGGGGSWSASVQPLQGGTGVTLEAPSSVTLPAGGHTTLTIPVSVAADAAGGDYSGYVMLQGPGRSLHVPYFVHVLSKTVTPGSVLLVDDTTSIYQAQPPNAPIVHKDVSTYFENALTALGKTYTYWNEAALGSPSLSDLKGTSTVIYFTGNNLNGYAHANQNYEWLPGPLTSLDVATMDAYLHQGGHVFVTGMAAVQSDLAFSAVLLGANVGSLSVFDNSANDKLGTGGIGPPQPSAVPDTRIDNIDNPENPWLFKNMKIDFSTKGDGAGTNVAINNDAVSHIFDPSWHTVGVAGAQAYNQKDPTYGDSWGQVVLRTADLSLAQTGGADIGIVNSDDSTFKNNPSSSTRYNGRSVLFTFDFAGINDNTGFATRQQVLKRVFDWFDDTPTTSVVSAGYRAGRAVKLRASLKALAGVRATQYVWQVGTATLKPTTGLTSYTFPRPGKYRIRAQVTDSLGHTAVSGWKSITAH